MKFLTHISENYLDLFMEAFREKSVCFIDEACYPDIIDHIKDRYEYYFIVARGSLCPKTKS